MARMSGDVQEVQTSVMASLFSIIKYPIMIVACLGMMLVISWQLTLFVFVMLPLFGVHNGDPWEKKLKEKSMKARKNKWGDILSNVEETIGGLRVVKAFNAEKMMERRFGAPDRGPVPHQQLRDAAHHHGPPHMSEFLGTHSRGGDPLVRRLPSYSPTDRASTPRRSSTIW